MKRSKEWIPIIRNFKKLVLCMNLCLIFLLGSGVSMMANEKEVSGDILVDSSTSLLQEDRTITGTVTDVNGEALPGVAIMVKGTTLGTITNFDGIYTLKVPADSKVLLISFIGFQTQEIEIGAKTKINVILEEENVGLEEVVVVGYGVQKKESVVGSITHASGEDLERSGGVTNVGEALQGKLPGVTAIAGSGMPGESDPQIFIRGQSSWNGSGQPLVLVDGIERAMSDIDFNEIDQMSVLKDASATAVFGVKGANGVILITTKRGKEGKAQLSVSANTTIKVISKIPKKLSSYDAIMKSNEAILREFGVAPDSFNEFFTPMSIADKYINPASDEERFKYPDIDWQDEIIKDFAQDYRVNFSVRGGNKFAKYFGSLSYQTVNDIVNGKKYDNGKGYLGEYSYNRFNYRSNLDFNLTKSTTVSVNLAGYFGVQNKPQDNPVTVVNGIYLMAPNLFTPVYPDGLHGRYHDPKYALNNPITGLTNSGYDTFNKFQINSDFKIKQKLDFITKGLSFQAMFSLDNNMTSKQELKDDGGDRGASILQRYYTPEGDEIIRPNTGVNEFDFAVAPWRLEPSKIQDDSRIRRLNYEASVNYNNVFAEKHYFTALLLFKREEYAKGNMFPRYREDWVSRLTYNYDSRYFIDVNGAYNGSEKFGPEFRFDLFPSVALGWMVSNESFLSRFSWIDKFKVKGSYGLVGDDNVGGRFKYLDQWASGGGARLDPSDYRKASTYVFFREKSVGNPNIQWETAIKSNIGAEMSLWRNSITAEFDYFTEKRDNIIVAGSTRSIPDFYGITPADFNNGKVEVKGFEFVLGAQHTFGNDIKVWSNYSITMAKDEIIEKDDPEFRPFYQNAKGYPIGQQRSAIPTKINESWDDVYASTPVINGQDFMRPGYYGVVDFDGNGVYDSAYDNAPFGYPVRPQKTWNFTVGSEYKGLGFSVQLYGTQNSTKKYQTKNFDNETNLFFEHSTDYWSKDNPTGKLVLPNFASGVQGATDPRGDFFDASLLRLKTVELYYKLPKKFCEKLGINSLKIFANGNNLYLWTNLPDDREFNRTSDNSFRGDYPTVKRFNMGLNLNF